MSQQGLFLCERRVIFLDLEMLPSPWRQFLLFESRFLLNSRKFPIP